MRSYKRVRPLLTLFLFLPLLTGAASAQTNCELGAKPLQDVQPDGYSPDDIIQKAAANEALLKIARQQYAYTQDIKAQTLRPGVLPGNFLPEGEFHQVAEVSYDANGKRIENVTFAPQSTITRLSLVQDDFDDLLVYNAFFLLPETLHLYSTRYLGQQRVDDLDTWVFEIAPKTVHPNKRYFQGRVWVEMHDLAIVKSCGKTVPDKLLPPGKKKGTENIHATIATYRDHIDGQYWLPVYERSDDYLHFRLGGDVRIREIVKFTGYHKAEPNRRRDTSLETAAH